MKRRVIWLATLYTILNLFVVSCASRPQPAGNRDEELIYLQTVLPQPLLELSNLQVASKENVALFSEDGATYLGLHLRSSQDRVNDGVRAEISVDYPFQAGDTVRY